MLAHLLTPVGFDLHGVDQDHFRVIGDGVLWDDLVDFTLGLLSDQTVDHLTALLWLTVEVAVFHGGAEVTLDHLDERLLGGGGLGDEDSGDGLDLGLSNSAESSIAQSLQATDQRLVEIGRAHV